MVQRRMIRKNNRIRMVLERIKKQTAVRENRNLLEEEQKNTVQKNGLREEAEFHDGGEKYALLVSVGNYQKQNLVDLVTWKSDLDLIQRGLTQGLKDVCPCGSWRLRSRILQRCSRKRIRFSFIFPVMGATES